MLRSAAVQSFDAAPGGCSADPAASQEPGQLIALESQHPHPAATTHQLVLFIAQADNRFYTARLIIRILI